MELKVFLCRMHSVKGSHSSSRIGLPKFCVPTTRNLFWSLCCQRNTLEMFGSPSILTLQSNPIPLLGEGRRQNLSTHQGDPSVPGKECIYGHFSPSQLLLVELMLHSPSGLFPACGHFSALTKDPVVTVSLLRQHRKNLTSSQMLLVSPIGSIPVQGHCYCS